MNKIQQYFKFNYNNHEDYIKMILNYTYINISFGQTLVQL